VLEVRRDDRVPADCVRVPAGHPSTAGLGAMFGEAQLAREPAEQEVSA
jgi:NADH-quinone oxidoreductase subunit G